MKKFEINDKFINENGAVVEILEPTKEGEVQFKIGSYIKKTSESDLQKMLSDNGYIKF